MKVHLGILGDPAKLEIYDDSFYSLFEFDTTSSCFYLFGASERDVSKNQYKEMYDKLINSNRNYCIEPLDLFSKVKNINSRIGLFPSSANHLIKGPSFVFGSYPANSKSKYLKIKAKLLIKGLNPFVPHNIIPIAYYPHGGKAGERTNVDKSLSESALINLIRKNRRKKWLKWHYLEAGSGEKSLPTQFIQNILKSQLETTDLQISNKKGYTIVPKTIYGGGIRSVKILDKILYPDIDNSLIPHCIIIGNISEEKISITKKIINRISEFNSEKT